MTHIEREINEQADVIERLLANEAGTAAKIAAAIKDFDPAFVVIAARGTSDNAARYAQYALGVHAGLSVGLATPSVHTLYESAPNFSRALVVGISQSGQSEDIRRVLSDARQQGAMTLSITNNPNSPLAERAAYHLPLGAGEEMSVAATKTYTAELAAVALLTSALASGLESDLARLPEHVRQTIAMSEAFSAERYRYMERFAVIGRGYNYCTAYEISLKIKELCYVTGEEYSEADFRHGPIATIQPGFPVMLVAPRGRTFPLIYDLLEQLQEKGAECLVITNDEACRPLAHTVLPIPDDIPEWLSPVAAVIPGQFFAMRLAVAKGHSVDKPRGLRKVTVTQ